MKCKYCGANIDKSDKKCSYCGRGNDDYVVPKPPQNPVIIEKQIVVNEEHSVKTDRPPRFFPILIWGFLVLVLGIMINEVEDKTQPIIVAITIIVAIITFIRIVFFIVARADYNDRHAKHNNH